MSKYNAIRTAGGTSEGIEFPSGFISAIGDISGGGSTEETITIESATLTTSSDYDDYFSQLITGWNTECIFIYLKNLNNVSASRRLLGGFSAYAYSKGMAVLYRYNIADNKFEQTTRNANAINIAVGDVYGVLRFGVLPT